MLFNSDAPAHHLFVLLPPTKNATTLPDPLVVIQVCLEGSIARASALASLSRGIRASGDLIPWVLSQQFQDDNFASLSGARVVRIATHPDFVGMGYGQRALRKLEEYYTGGNDGGSVTLDEESRDGKIDSVMKRVTDEELAVSFVFCFFLCFIFIFIFLSFSLFF